MAIIQIQNRSDLRVFICYGESSNLRRQASAVVILPGEVLITEISDENPAGLLLKYDGKYRRWKTELPLVDVVRYSDSDLHWS